MVKLEKKKYISGARCLVSQDKARELVKLETRELFFQHKILSQDSSILGTSTTPINLHLNSEKLTASIQVGHGSKLLQLLEINFFGTLCNGFFSTIIYLLRVLILGKYGTAFGGIWY